ncbi:DoxX family protein [Marmoricola sp. URHB0036]|uniref:DoxX family protein n=1 Tax=Marmoricola sp. URHB0036 TaxID=1298863 RepID=UPI000425D285|nr:DoxX family protein [Marmoricola sp. URHB0036]
MRTTVWITSVLLAAAFVMTGAGKLFVSVEDLRQSAQGVPVAMLRIAGAAEILGAIGLVLPAATRVLPVLTPVAASALTVTMVAATLTNISIGEPGTSIATGVLGMVSAAVAWARFGRYSVQPRRSTSPAFSLLGA